MLTALNDSIWDLAFETVGCSRSPVYTEALPARRSLRAFVHGNHKGCADLRGHCERVAFYSTQIGQKIGMEASRIGRLNLAGLLHDCGKIALDAQVLDKPSSLTYDERLYVQTHSICGADLLHETSELHDLVPAVLHHHERWDGKGYPMGLSGTETPLDARIIAIADSFDAITSPRSYSANLNFTQGFGILLAERGAQFDPELVDAFASCHPDAAELSRLIEA